MRSRQRASLIGIRNSANKRADKSCCEAVEVRRYGGWEGINEEAPINYPDERKG